MKRGGNRCGLDYHGAWALIWLILLFCAALSGAQQTTYTPDIGSVGFPTNGVFSGGSVDTVQLANGNLHVEIPLLHLPGIGLNTDISLTYDSAVWNVQQGPYQSTTYSLITMSRPHWQIKDPMAGFFKWGLHPVRWQCNPTEYPNLSSGSGIYVDYVTFTDEDGTVHQFPASGLTPATGIPPSQCYSGPTNVMNTDVYSEDASGYHLVLNSNGGIVSLTDKHGTNYYFTQTQITGPNFQPQLSGGNPSSPSVFAGSASNPVGPTTFIWAQSTKVEDSNGNMQTCCGTVAGNPSAFTIADTADRTITETSVSGGEFPHLAGGMTMESMGPQVEQIGYQDQNDHTQSITVTYSPVQLSLWCSAGQLYCGTDVGFQMSSLMAELPQSIVLQNGESYQFSYDDVGDITSITLPTGGTIQYTWSASGAASDDRYVLSRTVTANGQSSVWNYSYAANQQGTLTTTVTDPNENDAAFTFANGNLGFAAARPGNYLTSEVLYSGRTSSNAPKVTKTVGYGDYGCQMSLLPTSQVFTWNESGQTAETDTYYDGPNPSTCGSSPTGFTRGNPMQTIAYDYGTGGTHGPLLKNTVYSYVSDNNNAYSTANIADRVSQVSVYDSSSTLVSQTTTGYDAFNYGGQGGPTAPGWTTNHDTAYGSSTTLRGLPTSVTEYVGPSFSAISTYTNYNVLGQPTAETDGRGKTTTITYGSGSSAFNGFQCGAAWLSITSMPQTTTNGSAISHQLQQCQDSNTGLVIAKADQNNPANATSYTYDPLMRVLRETRPDGGGTTNSYPDSNHTISSVAEDAQRTATTTVALDGLGRKISSSTTADAICGSLTVDTGYDLLGHVQMVSNPHCASPGVTDGITTYSYDAIGRLYYKQNPDGSAQQWSFSGSTIDFYDETERHWRHTYDAEDRLTKVMEPDGGNSPTLETDYTYDTLGNLKQVDQWGGPNGSSGDHMRKFAYDAVSRLIASNNPESASASSPAAQTCTGTQSGTYWTGCYSYDGNGNLTQKVDNRGITIGYSYDALNRLLTKTYSDSTPAVAFAYDSTSISGRSNDTGEMTQATVSNGSGILAQTNAYAFDQIGRLLDEQQCTTATNCSGAPYQLAYTYDWAGKPQTMTFPSNAPGNGNQSGQPLTLTYSYDPMERLLTAQSNWVAHGDAKHPGALFQAPPAGTNVPAYGTMGLVNASIGVNSSSDSTVATLQREYDARGRTVSAVYAAGANSISDSAGAGSVTISGNEAAPITKTSSPSGVILPNPTQSLVCGSNPYQFTNNYCFPPKQDPSTEYYSGTVTVTVLAPTQFQVYGYCNESDENIADALTQIVAGLNASGSPVTATLNSDNSVTLVSKSSGSSVNYPVSVNVNQTAPTYDPGAPTSCY